MSPCLWSIIIRIIGKGPRRLVWMFCSIAVGLGSRSPAFFLMDSRLRSPPTGSTRVVRNSLYYAALLLLWLVILLLVLPLYYSMLVFFGHNEGCYPSITVWWLLILFSYYYNNSYYCVVLPYISSAASIKLLLTMEASDHFYLNN